MVKEFSFEEKTPTGNAFSNQSPQRMSLVGPSSNFANSETEGSFVNRDNNDLDKNLKLRKSADITPREDFSTTTASSTKIIESLHQKLDALTNTNLQLTLQSHNLLEKLDAAQKKEVKLSENISLYTHEHDNLDSILQRKVRKLTEVDEELQSLRMTFQSVENTNKDLSSKLKSSTDSEKSIKDKIRVLRDQYESILENQSSYKAHFVTEIENLNNRIQSLKTEYKLSIKEKINGENDDNNIDSSNNDNSTTIANKINKFNYIMEQIRHHNFEMRSLDGLDKKMSESAMELGLESWLGLFKVCNEMIKDYAEQKKLDLNDFDADHIINDPFISSMEEELKREKVEISETTTKRGGRSISSSSRGNSPQTTANSRMNTPKVAAVNNRKNYYTATSSNIPGSNVAGYTSLALPGMKRASSYNARHSKILEQAKASSAVNYSEQRRKRSSIINNPSNNSSYKSNI